MRAKEFITETLNPECFRPDFQHELELNGLTLKASNYKDEFGNFLVIRAFDGDEDVGVVRFKTFKNLEGQYWLESFMTSIHPGYRGKHLARDIYAYAKMLGNDIKPSKDQSDSGRAMWQSWQDSGEAEHLMKEDATPEILYHVTPTRNVKSILAKGLVPSIGARSAQLETQSNLFFFPSREAAEDAVMNWLGDELPEDEPLALLAVSSKGLEGKFTPGAEYEVTVSSPVPPQNIKVVSTNL